MAKRFTDTEKFKDPWYRKLSLLHKCVWEYLLSSCDHAGFIKVDLELMSFQIGAEVEKSDLEFFGDRLEFINEDLIFIPKFITFQYGVLNPENKVHNSALKILNKHNIKGLGSPLVGAKDKDKDKTKNKDMFLESLNLIDMAKNSDCDKSIEAFYDDLVVSYPGELISAALRAWIDKNKNEKGVKNFKKRFEAWVKTYSEHQKQKEGVNIPDAAPLFEPDEPHPADDIQTKEQAIAHIMTHHVLYRHKGKNLELIKRFKIDNSEII